MTTQIFYPLGYKYQVFDSSHLLDLERSMTKSFQINLIAANANNIPTEIFK